MVATHVPSACMKLFHGRTDFRSLLRKGFRLSAIPHHRHQDHLLHHWHQMVYTKYVKRATISLQDDLAEAGRQLPSSPGSSPRTDDYYAGGLTRIPECAWISAGAPSV